LIGQALFLQGFSLKGMGLTAAKPYQMSTFSIVPITIQSTKNKNLDFAILVSYPSFLYKDSFREINQ
jgi:hypothetical protein